MTCNDCIHYEVCKVHGMNVDDTNFRKEFCGCFKDKSRFVELPCKVGDYVYIPWEYEFIRGIASVRIEDIRVYDSQNHFMFLIDMESDDEVFNQSFGGWKTDKSIGNTVFLTREEAEKKLEELKK